MMNKAISRYHDLIREEERLKGLLKDREAYLREHQYLLEEELEPYFKGMARIRKLFSLSNDNPTFQFGLKKLSVFLLRNLFRSGTRGWGKLAAPFVVRYLSDRLIKKFSSPLLDTLKSWLGISKKNHGTAQEQHPAGDEKRGTP